MSYSKYGYLTNDQINNTGSVSGIINSPLSIVGDLWGYNGASDTRVAVDANDKVLTCDSVSSVGVSYKFVDHDNLLNKGTNTHAQIDSHISTTSAHGVTGDVVGTNNTQTLTNKTLTSPIISGLNISDTPPFESLDVILLGRKIDGSIVHHAVNPLLVKSLNVENEPFTDNTQTQILCRESTQGGLRLRSNIVDTTTAQTLTNKTLTTPIISTISNTGTLTLPTTTGTVALTSDIPSLTNYVTLDGTQTVTGAKTFQNLGTSTGGFYAIGTTPGGNAPVTAGVFLGKNTATADYGIEIATLLGIDKSYIDFTYVANDYTGRIIMDHATSTMDIIAPNSNIKLDNKVRLSSDLLLTAVPTTDNTSDVLARTSTGDVVIRTDNVTLAGSQTLTNKILTSPVITNIASGGGNWTVPAATDTMVGRNTADTMSNKTLTAPIINSGVFRGTRADFSPDVGGVYIGEGGTNDMAIEICSVTNIANSYIDFTKPTFDFSSRLIHLHATNIFQIIAPSSSITMGTAIAMSPGLTLPTTGGTPAVLDFYETGTIAMSFTGPYASPVATTLKFVRMGVMVSLFIPAFDGTATSANFIQGATSLAARLRPAISNLTICRVWDNSVLQVDPGQITVSTGGILNVYRTLGSTNTFTASGTCGTTNGMWCTYAIS